MAGYIGSKAVNLSTTGADINGDANIDGNLSLGDNNKAIFGAGSDLQIYHDGSNSFISDQGTGNLKVLADNFRIRNAADTDSYIYVNSGAEVGLTYSGATKLTTQSSGVDITGTLTSDGLTVESTAGAVAKIGRSDTAIALNDVLGQLDFTTNDVSTTEPIRGQMKVVSDGTSGNSSLYVSTASGNTLSSRIKVSFGGDISFYEDTGTTPKFFWDASAESLGIGTSSPAALLHLESSSPVIRLKDTDGAAYHQVFASLGDLYIDSDRGNNVATSSIIFRNDATERMRIDGSGNLLVGKDSTATGAGFEARSDGQIVGTRSSNRVAFLNRLTSDGSILDFAKDGTTVGSIGVETVSGNGYPFICNTQSGNAGLYFAGRIQPTDHTGDRSDNTVDLGFSSFRFDDIYATNGTIQTSDRNEKQDIAELSDAEQRVAVAAKGLMRKFRWRDAVAEKGDEARTHFGIIAQDLQAAFAAEGLDAGDYAMFISSTWTDEKTGEERTRMGVRYSELLAFIIGAL